MTDKNDLMIFENPEFGQVRTTLVNNEPWFVVADVCKALELGNTTRAVSRLDDDERMTFTIKAVQGDSGHAQVKMVTDVYSHILDDDRKNNAQLFQETFYEKDIKSEQPQIELPEGITPEALSKMLENPEIVALLGALAKKL